MEAYTSNTLCGSCTRGAGECSFMARLIPVPGWEAEKVAYENPGREPSYTYAVKACPLFAPARTGSKHKFTQKKCGRCGKEFIPKCGSQKYCGAFCAIMARELGKK